nr:uncharacterized protein LOC109154913 [Ipomoea trifida]
MDDLWSKLFEDSYANGEGCVAPTMDPQLVQPVDIEEENIESEEENRTRQGFEDLLYSQDNQHSSQLHDLEVDESSFWNNFMSEVNHCVGNQDVSGTQVPRQSQSNNVRKCAETQNIGLKPTQMKRKRRQSGGAAQLSSQLDSLISNSNRALDVLIGDNTVNTQSTTTVSLAAAISVINRMVTDGPPSSSIAAVEFHIHVASIVNHRQKSSIADQRRKTRVAGAVATGLSLLPLTSLKEAILSPFNLIIPVHHHRQSLFDVVVIARPPEDKTELKGYWLSFVMAASVAAVGGDGCVRWLVFTAVGQVAASTLRADIGGVVELFSGGVSGSDGGEIGSQWLTNTTVK